MEIAYLYSKQRARFGAPCHFEDVEPRILEAIPSFPVEECKETAKPVLKNPVLLTLDTTPDMSAASVRTAPIVLDDIGMMHTEGGWPNEIDTDDADAVERFRKKREKGTKAKVQGGTTVPALEPLGASIKRLGPVVQLCVKQNNTIDIYEEYFSEFLPDHSSEPPSAKGLAVFRDPCDVRRTASTIDWHPDGPSRIAVSYSIMRFQDPRLLSKATPQKSYIWDVSKPNAPETVLEPQSPLCCLRFNPKNPELLVGGSYNGLVSFFDRRKDTKPREASVIEKSHHDPVFDVRWTQSKTGTTCASCSTDGRMLWWDIRRLSEPTSSIEVRDGQNKKLGVSAMAYSAEAGPSKYLLGTEQGVVVNVNTRAKKHNNGVTVFSKGPGKHHAPIYAIERNPIHSKFFMTVGDWTARIWVEDLKTPIMTTKYHASYLTSGCWSPTRPGVFFVTRADGVVDVWDYFYRQNEVAYSHKLGDEALSSIAVCGGSGGGRLVAVGDDAGTVSLLELSESLSQMQSNEKPAMLGMFDRETKREKNLNALAKETEPKGDDGVDADMADASKEEEEEEELMKVDAQFVELIKDDGGDKA